MPRYQKRVIVPLLKLFLCCVGLFLLVRLGLVLLGDESRPLPTSSDLEELLAEAHIDNKLRIENVRNVCRKYNLGNYARSDESAAFKHPGAPQYTVFYFDRSHNISYCPIYKAGSTTWIYNLCLLMNVSESELTIGKEQISTIARRKLPELEYPEGEEVLSSTAKLLVVRHPFERLLSAYRDKLENSVAGREHGTLHFYRKYGAKIVQKYRSERFVKPRDDQVIRRDDLPPPSGAEPTFREFVQYLINSDIANYGDDHWLPYYLFCTPCVVNYDLIAKVESLWRDQVYAIHRLNLQERIKPRWRHSGGRPDAAKIYFSQLDRSMVENLYEKFRLDFELFDYHPDTYYTYAVSS